MEESNKPAPAPAVSLAKLADDVLRRPARERLELLLHAPQPMRLVRSIPDGELYLTVREVGPHDALPLMALASAQQIQHLMDLEAWRGDRFDADRAGAWVAFLLESGEPTLIRYLRSADDEQLALLFAKWMRVSQIEIDDTPSPHGHGETEAGTEEGFLAPDGWHRFSPTISSHAAAVRQIAETLMQDDSERYERVVRDALWEMPSELEERAYHWRNSRLEEHGFPPREEAMSVFSAPTGARGHGRPPEPGREGDLAAPRAVLRLEQEGSLFAVGLATLDDETQERLLFETAAVANRILVADQSDAGDPAAHRDATKMVAGYLEIALALRGIASAEGSAAALCDVPVLELFREGYARAGELRETARELIRSGWPAHHRRALEVLDPALRGALSALLLRRPAFFDAGSSAEPGAAVREFRSLRELTQAQSALRIARLLGRAIFDVLGWRVEDLEPLASKDGVLPAASTLLATSFARHAVDGRLGAGPVSIEAVKELSRRLASDRKALLESFGKDIAAALHAEDEDRTLLSAYLGSLVVPPGDGGDFTQRILVR